MPVAGWRHDERRPTTRAGPRGRRARDPTRQPAVGDGGLRRVDDHGGHHRFGSQRWRKPRRSRRPDIKIDGDYDLFSAHSKDGLDYELEQGTRIGDTVKAAGSAVNAIRPTVYHDPGHPGCVTLFFDTYDRSKSDKGKGGQEVHHIQYATSSDYGLTFGPVAVLNNEHGVALTAAVKGSNGPSILRLPSAKTLLYMDVHAGAPFIYVGDLVVAGPG